jgi:protein-tyrosine phosphatase
VWSFFKPKQVTKPIFKTDLHSHLLPGLDDGVKSFEEAESVILALGECGFTKAITTPHVMADHYRNNSDGIKSKLKELEIYLKQKGISFSVEAAAEYFFDESLMEQVDNQAALLTFGDKYILFETNTFTEPMMLNDFIFKLKVQNYKPVMAHPERYQYLHGNFARIEDLQDRGVLFQVNALSLSGYYSGEVQKIARQLVERKVVHFLGSDCHNLNHARHLKKAIQHKYFLKALELPLLNYSI